MNSVPVPEKTTVINVSAREVSFFEKNYPVHYQVLMELVKRGEARIIDAPEAHL